MIRRLLVTLVFANALVFAWNRGWFAPWLPGDREPYRIAGQHDAERLRPVPLSQLEATRERPGRRGSPPGENLGSSPASPAPAPATPAGPPPTPPAGSSPAETAPTTPVPASPSSSSPAPDSAKQASAVVASGASGLYERTGVATQGSCQVFAAIDEERAPGLRAALEATGARVETQRIEQGASYLVYVPPAASLVDAQRRLVELRRIGRSDAFLIQEGPYRLGISLAVYRFESAARALVEQLSAAGQLDALVAARAPIQVRVRLQAHWSDRNASAAAAMLGAQFDAPARECG